MGVEVGYDAVLSADAGDGGVAHGQLLSALADAVFEREPEALARARSELAAAAGPDVVVDAVGVCANFFMMTRIADGTGTPLDRGTAEMSAQVRELVGVNDLTSRRD